MRDVRPRKERQQNISENAARRAALSAVYAAGSTRIAATPLETARYHCLIECPEIVENDSEPLFVTIKADDGSIYRYDIR